MPERRSVEADNDIYGFDLLYGVPPVLPAVIEPAIRCRGVREGRLSQSGCFFVSRIILHHRSLAPSFLNM